jgi:glutamate:Na+ symporter, ESS family
VPTLKLDMIQTVALAAVVLFIGYGVRRRVGVLDRFNIPAPVIGGFAFAILALILRQTNVLVVEFDTLLQTPLMISFFTTIGLGASLVLLKRGGPQVVIFWLIASVLAVIQNGVGMGIAGAMGVDPKFGLIAGSITMTGGHGTGAAFGRLIEEQYQLQGAFALAMAAATFGLVAGGLLGGPLGTALIRRHNLKPAAASMSPAKRDEAEAAPLDAEIDVEPTGEVPSAYHSMQMIALVLACMAVGSVVSGFAARFITLPAYIGAMLVAAVARNVFDFSGWLRIAPRTIDNIGTISLALFLTMALMSLRLWELFDLALPLLVILLAQTLVMWGFAAWITFRAMGRDYDAGVMAAGHCGFGMGATPSAVANMGSLVEKFGPAPRAFLVLPMVGALFIDFSNALIITTFLNIGR